MLETFSVLLNAARGLDLSDPEAAERLLNERFDPNGAEAGELARELARLVEAGEIANRGEKPMRWGRALKPSEASFRFSIDVVELAGEGPRHRHPAGEIDLCIPVEGTPLFDGRNPGWVVLEPDSVHVPTVTGGTMLIVYLLPEGEIEFLA